MATRRLSAPLSRIVTKHAAPAPAGLHCARQKFTSVRALPFSLSNRRRPGFSPAMRTFTGGPGGRRGTPAGDSWENAAVAVNARAAMARKAALSLTIIDELLCVSLSKVDLRAQPELTRRENARRKLPVRAEGLIDSGHGRTVGYVVEVGCRRDSQSLA